MRIAKYLLGSVTVVNYVLANESLILAEDKINAHSSRLLKKAKKAKKGKAKKEKKVKNGASISSPMANIVTVGARPYYLIDSMTSSWLKDDLSQCASEMTMFAKSDFSIGHRGACMQYPEHTLRSFKAASLMGAGIIECDVTFTKDRELICRHAQCDLHTTTDVVGRPEMNAKCTTPWAPGVSPKCCASDFTLEEIKTLCAKMDSKVGDADTAEGYVFGGTAAWRTDVHQYECPSVPTHKESIELIMSLGGKYTPELKSPSVDMPYEGEYTQEMYAQQMIDEYIEMGVDPNDVWPQSFNVDDVIYWVENTDFGDQAVFLDNNYDLSRDYTAYLTDAASAGVKIVAPPMFMLIKQDDSADFGMAESDYASFAKSQGLDIITWTLERTGPSPTGVNGFYWQTTADLDRTEGSKYELLYVLAYEVGILGIFSDWPAPVTFFANCMNLMLR